MTHTAAIGQLYRFLYEEDTRTQASASKIQRQMKKREEQTENPQEPTKPKLLQIDGPMLSSSKRKRRVVYALLFFILILFVPSLPVLQLANSYLPASTAHIIEDFYSNTLGFDVGEKQTKTDTVEEPLLTVLPVLMDPGKSKADAVAMQTRLAELGYYKSGIDGVWGRGSRGSLKKFKTVNKLPSDSIWNRETQNLLFSGKAIKVPTK